MQKVCRILLLFLLDLIPLRICLTCLTCVFDYNIILCFVDIETLYNPYYSLKLMKVWRNSEMCQNIPLVLVHTTILQT